MDMAIFFMLLFLWHDKNLSTNRPAYFRNKTGEDNMNTRQPVQIHATEDFAALGIKSIAYAQLSDINNQVPYNEELSVLLHQAKEKALNITDSEMENNTTLNGYRQMIKNHGRSLKKFPPSAQAFIKIIQRNKTFPSINPVVDIYNSFVIDTLLSIGAHDLDKIKGAINFRLSTGEEHFIAIGGEEKKTFERDFVYADEEKILAWLNTRDSDLAKITEDTKNIILMIQGNPDTPLEYRLEALQKIGTQITQTCGGTFSVHSVTTL